MRVNDADELRSRILTAWDELRHLLIRQSRSGAGVLTLNACVKAKGGHWKHKLS